MTVRILLLAPVLAACSLPVEDRCFDTASRELATVYSLITEAEDAALRGYKVVEGHWVDLEVSDCYATLGPRSICTTQYETPVRRPIAVDPSQEREIADSLRARVPDLKERAISDYKACLLSAQAR